ncbi:MAG: beta-ketoacyl-ACP synthase III [Waddliaceae bacterium]
MLQARLTGFGSYVPDDVLCNHDLEKIVDTTNDWIVTRTGIEERRIAKENETSSDMAIQAGKDALNDAGIDPDRVDLVVVATATPDYLMPSTAALVQAELGAVNAAAVDFQAACTGYLYGLSMAKAYVESGIYRTILLIASDKMSAFIDYQDRNTCVLFGDGASAAVIAHKGSGLAISSICLGADGKQAELIMIPAGGSKYPASSQTVSQGQHYFKMSGKEVFKHAVRRMSSAAQECLHQAKLREDEISWLVPHQANERIIDAMAKQFHIPLSQVAKTLKKYGNTCAPSLAITLDELQKTKTINTGEHLLLAAFGAGLTWGAAVLTKI